MLTSIRRDSMDHLLEGSVLDLHGLVKRTRLIAAIDSGTQSTRCIIYEAESMVKLAASNKFEHPLESPTEGWSQHRCSVITESVVRALCDALSRFNPKTHEVVALGITNQRETIVAWDGETGQLLSEFTICWNDMRTADDVNRFKSECSPEDIAMIRRKTGLPIASYYSASKMKWMIEHIDAVGEAAISGNLRFGTIDSYLIYRLSNQKVHVTDITNASRTLLFDIHKLQFDQELCTMWNVPLSSLPEVKASCDIFAYIPKDTMEYQDIAIFQNLPKIIEGVPISGVLGDQQAATIGHGLVDEGGTKLTFGSGGFLLMNCGRGALDDIPEGCSMSPLVMAKGDRSPLYCVEGSIAVAGLGLTWMKKNRLVQLEEIEAMIQETSSSEGLIFLPAFSGLLSPWWNEELKGSIMGITLKTERRHIVRAYLESLAVQVRAILSSIAATGHFAHMIHLDGGLSQSDAFLQILSDFTRSTIHRPPDCEMTARGAALCALIGADKGDTLDAWQQVHALSHEFAKGAQSMSYRFMPCDRSADVDYVNHIKNQWNAYYEVMARFHRENEQLIQTVAPTPVAQSFEAKQNREIRDNFQALDCADDLGRPRAPLTD